MQKLLLTIFHGILVDFLSRNNTRERANCITRAVRQKQTGKGVKDSPGHLALVKDSSLTLCCWLFANGLYIRYSYTYTGGLSLVVLYMRMRKIQKSEEEEVSSSTYIHICGEGRAPPDSVLDRPASS